MAAANFSSMQQNLLCCSTNKVCCIVFIQHYHVKTRAWHKCFTLIQEICLLCYRYQWTFTVKYNTMVLWGIMHSKFSMHQLPKRSTSWGYCSMYLCIYIYIYNRQWNPWNLWIIGYDPFTSTRPSLCMVAIHHPLSLNPFKSAYYAHTSPPFP